MLARTLAAVLVTALPVPAQLSGAYLVGPGGNYPDIAAAIGALAAGVTGPVTFYVFVNDAGPWTIPAFPGQGPANPVSFEALGGPIALAGPQPVLTLDGCAHVTFRGFTGQFAALPGAIVVAGSTSACTFRECDFRASTISSGLTGAVFTFAGGNGCRIEDCTFGGGYEALHAMAANTGTTVQRCRIVGGGFWIMRIAGADFTLVNNQITGGSNYGISAGLSGGNQTLAANLRIRGNSFWIDHAPTLLPSQYCALRWYTTAPGTEVVDNVIVDVFPSAAGFNLWCSGAARPEVMDFNCLWSFSPAYFPVHADSDRTFVGWQTLGFDAHSVAADPACAAPSASPPDLRLQPGSPCAAAGTFLPGVLTDLALAPRTVPVSIGAFENDRPGTAAYALAGAGCAGSAGVPSNTISAPPRLGTSPVITFGSLPPPALGIAVFGLSNVFHGATPLPFALGPLGAPGCELRVSPDATLALAGAGGAASIVFPVPNAPLFVGFTFHTQALVPDPAANALGVTVSDAAVAIVGW